MSLFSVRKLIHATFITISLILFSFSPVYGDRGGLSPVTIFEYGQRAIIAWNGTDEMLILSTDVSASEESFILSFLPLPSNPLIDEGNFMSFTEMQSLVQRHFSHERFSLGPGGSVEITFHEKIGAHDITVVKVTDAEGLKTWILDFLEDHEMEYGEFQSNYFDLLKNL